MIKITYNGFVVEVDSVAQAKELMTTEKVVGVDFAYANVPTKTKKVKSHKTWSHSNWTPEELEQIFSYKDLGFPPDEIRKDKMLRERHTKIAIDQFMSVFKARKYSQMSKVIAGMVRDYYYDTIK